MSWQPPPYTMASTTTPPAAALVPKLASASIRVASSVGSSVEQHPPVVVSTSVEPHPPVMRTCTPTGSLVSEHSTQAFAVADGCAGRLTQDVTYRSSKMEMAQALASLASEHAAQDGTYRPVETSDGKEQPPNLEHMQRALREAERLRATWELQVALRREHVETARLRVQAQALDEQLTMSTMPGSQHHYRPSAHGEESSGETIREAAEESETSAVSFSAPAFANGAMAPGAAAAMALKDFPFATSQRSGQFSLGKRNEGWVGGGSSAGAGVPDGRFEDADHSPRRMAVGGS